MHRILFTRGRLSPICAALIATALAACHSGEPVPVAEKKELIPQSFRPFKQFPDVLFLDTFESQPKWTDFGKVVDAGKLEKDEPPPPADHCLKFVTAEWGKNDHVVWMSGHFSRTPLSVPHGLDPAKLYMQTMIWPEDSGELTIKLHFAKGDYSHAQPGLKAKAWNPVTVRLLDIRNKNVHPEIDHLIDVIDVAFKPPKSHKVDPRVYMSELVVTYITKPEEVLPRVMVAEKKRTDALKLLDRDGYTFSLDAHDKLKAALKSFKGSIKPKTAIVIGEAPVTTPQWVKALTAASAAGKPKDAGFTFKPALNPEAASGAENTAGGMADGRLFLPAAIASDPQFAVIVFGPDDVADVKNHAENNLRVIVERTLADGTIPVVVAPSPRVVEEGLRFDDFYISASKTCTDLGVPLVSMMYKIPRKAKEPNKERAEFDFSKPPPVETPETTAPKIIEALKHVQESLLKD